MPAFIRRDLLRWSLSALALSTVPVVRASAAPQEGDLVFHTSRSAQSLAVQRATGSRWSHMGVLMPHQGRLMVLEAVETVRYTPLKRWAERGERGHLVRKRLRDAQTQLTPAALLRLRAEGERLRGRPYDLRFEWSDSHIYCSELVWKMYERALGLRIGEPAPVRSFHLSDPAVQAKMRERYGRAVPLDEPVISPVAMFESPLLLTVAGT